MNLLKYMKHILYSTSCICCGKYIGFNEVLCKKCARQITPNRYYACENCSKYVCICKQLKPIFKKVIVPFDYDEISKLAVIRLKFNNKSSNADPMAEFIYQIIIKKNIVQILT